MHSFTPSTAASAPAAIPVAIKSRIVSIDALRGVVILLMLVDHVREFFYLHAQVSDPMDLSSTPPALFFTRLAAHLCAPIFVALTGLGAWLFAASNGTAAASSFLLKRGLFLVVLEVTVINLAWTFSLTPETLYLQVIWAIGLSMIALAALLHLPRAALIAAGLLILFGHNLLDPIAFAVDEPGHALWAALHDRGHVDLPWGGQARTSYPVLPWIGVIALGYAIGPWFSKGFDPQRRRRLLVGAGAVAFLLFAVLRAINGYGEPSPWEAGSTPLQTVMSFLNLTKYPPSADFLLLTLGVGLMALAALERLPPRPARILVTYGSAPLFFYVVHLYLLHLTNLAALSIWGATADGLFSLANVASIWVMALLVAMPCWFACRWFGQRKRTTKIWWLRYL